MTSTVGILRQLGGDTRGAAAIEFAILGPLLISMLLGVLMVGMQMQTYNSLRAVAFDVNRYVVVEYQKGNKLSNGQIEQVAYSLASAEPYSLKRQFKATVPQAEEVMTGAKKFVLTVEYQPAAVNALIDVTPPKLTYDQSIIVVD